MNTEPNPDPIAAPCGEVLPTLPRRLGCLAHWLERPSLLPYELACLFLGVLPNQDHSRGFGGNLPGTEPWPLREAWEWRMKRNIVELEQRIGTISRVSFMPTAKALLTVEKELGKRPAWLEAARGYAECADRLPTAWRKEPGADKKPKR